MFLLDTNVVSELMRARPEPRVGEWISARDSHDIHLSAPSEAELRLGILLMPAGNRRDTLSAEVLDMLATDFAGRILPFDSRAALHFAEVIAARRRAGRPIAHMDAQIAAIAAANGLTLVTRNTRDFEGAGLTLINPWNSP